MRGQGTVPGCESDTRYWESDNAGGETRRTTVMTAGTTSPQPPSLQLSVLGATRLRFAGNEITFTKRKARALLAYLSLTDGQTDTRERLGGLLWSEVTETRARTSLRQELHQIDETLRRAGAKGLQRDRLTVTLSEQIVSIDATVILRQVHAGVINPRLIQEAHISKSFLRDIDDVDPAFAIWARARRQAFHDQLLHGLEATLRGGALLRADRRRCAQAILNLDPTHEEACRVYMRLSAEAGDAAAAQRAYNTLYTLLDKDYDAEPSPETMALIALIKQGQIPQIADPEEPRPPPTPTDPPRTRMALLIEPFGMNGIAPDDQHLVDGFRHELLASLVRFREWSVVAAQSLPSGQAADSIAGAFAVAATAYRAGDLISMVLTLREIDTGVHIWGNRYTLTLGNWFGAQQDIVQKIAVSLDVEVSAERLRRIASTPSVSLAAYDLWLRGQAAMLRFDRPNWETGRNMFQAAIDQAPEFARGYSGLAQIVTFAHLIHPGLSPTEVVIQQALDLSNHAVSLDPMDPRSQLAMGWTLAMGRNFGTASVHLALACALNPNDTWVLVSAALCQAFCGDIAQAQRMAEDAMRLTIVPSRRQWACLALIAFMAGDDAKAIDAAERTQAVMLPIIAWHAAALARSGAIAEAERAAAHCISLAQASWAGPNTPSAAAVGRWLLEMFPFANTADWMQLRDSLSEAGIPANGMKPPGGRA